MKRLIQFIKSIKPTQLLGVFLASCLLFVSTACSQGNIAQTETSPDKKQVTAPASPNVYSDNLRETDETKAKAKALIDKAKSLQQGNLGDYPEDIGDRIMDEIEQAQKEVPQYLEAQKDKAVKDIKQTANTLKENVSNATNEAREVFDEAVDTAQDAIEDATEATKNTAEEFKDNIKDLT